VKDLRALSATACLAVFLVASAGHSQERPPSRGPAPHGGAPYGYYAPPVYGPPIHPAYPGRQTPPAPPAGYGPYGPTYPPRSNSLGADWREQQDLARQGVRQGQMAPLGRVIEGIHRHTPGRELDAGIEFQGVRPVYRVRWITIQGRRVDYIVDAATGQILSER
jgi:hypothetical protein